MSEDHRNKHAMNCYKNKRACSVCQSEKAQRERDRRRKENQMGVM